MSVNTFIICASLDSQALQKKIIEEFGENDEVYVVRDGSQWLVAAEMTTKQVYDKVELDEETRPSVVVFLTANYWGNHKKDMWEWLELD